MKTTIALVAVLITNAILMALGEHPMWQRTAIHLMAAIASMMLLDFGFLCWLFNIPLSVFMGRL